MPGKKLIDVSKLNQTLTVYDKALRTLPFATISEVSSKLGLNVMDLQGKHTRINERRRAGGTQSYKIGKEFKELETILGYEPSNIEPKDVVFITHENSQKYDDLELLIIGGQPVSNITKKHPLEQKVAFNLVKSHAEDVVYEMFTASRDDDSTSPSGAFDGFYTKIDKLIIAKEVNPARGNYAVSGTFEMPLDTNDTAAYDNLVEWIGGANNYLRSSRYGIPQLLCAESVLVAARAALRNKLRLFDYPSMQKLFESIREDAMCPGLEIVSHEALGLGNRLIMQKKGNMDFAFNTQAASRFCQVRDIYTDPNEWQFWLQSGYDTRVNDWHEKVFRTNEQKNTALDLAGDYCNTGGVLMTLTNDDGKGTFSVKGQGAQRMSGQYIIGLKPGKHTITFGAVDSKTKPSDKQVTIEAGKITEDTAAYT